MERALRILLINMPFAGIDRPSLGLSLLQATARDRGHTCDIAYLNLWFAEWVGKGLYDNVSNSGALDADDGVPYTVMAGEWIFARWLFGDRALGSQEYLETILAPSVSRRAFEKVLRMAELVPRFLDSCLERIRWQDYDLVGFTSTFEQNLASLSLAQAVKARFPHLRLALGGANCEDEMGREILARFPFVDAVCLGEGDRAFPQLLEALTTDGPPGPLPGIAHRLTSDVDEAIVEATQVEPVQDLDELPVPSFDDYFAQLAASPLGEELIPWIQMEGSRGCWWGAKQHCTFCGLNGQTMAFRRKSAEPLLQEIEANVQRYQTPYVSFTDNILDHKAFEDLVPRLEERLPGLRIFFEVKSNLKRAQVQALGRAGIHEVQPGIESFSSAVLKRMRKGVTGLQNLAFLRYCAESGVRPLWNVLYGFPGEQAEEYEHQLGVLQRATHLEPPTTVCQIRLDRFSPNYVNSEALGFRRLRPKEPYRHLYPFGDASRAKLAYFFDYDYAEPQEPEAYTRGLVQFWRRFTEHPEPGTLEWQEGEGGGGRIVDSRFNRRLDGVQLDARQAAVYRVCGEPSSLDRVMAQVRRSVGFSLERQDVAELLAWLDGHLWMASEDGKYLALALRRDTSGEGVAGNHGRRESHAAGG